MAPVVYLELLNLFLYFVFVAHINDRNIFERIVLLFQPIVQFHFFRLISLPGAQNLLQVLPPKGRKIVTRLEIGLFFDWLTHSVARTS